MFDDECVCFFHVTEITTGIIPMTMIGLTMKGHSLERDYYEWMAV